MQLAECWLGLLSAKLLFSCLSQELLEQVRSDEYNETDLDPEWLQLLQVGHTWSCVARAEYTADAYARAHCLQRHFLAQPSMRPFKSFAAACFFWDELPNLCRNALTHEAHHEAHHSSRAWLVLLACRSLTGGSPRRASQH